MDVACGILSAGRGLQLRTLYVMDPLDKIDVGGDSTYMLMLEGVDVAARVAWCTPMDLYALTGRCHARCQRVHVSDEAPYFHSESPEERDLSEFDVVWLRKDPPFDIAYVFSTYMLDLVSRGTLVLNDPASIRDANEKMVALRYPDLVPTTLVTADIDRAMAWAADVPGKVVLKPWDPEMEDEVYSSQHGDGNMRSMLELLTDEGRTHILLQHYIPEIREGDKRIILIDGKPEGG